MANEQPKSAEDHKQQVAAVQAEAEALPVGWVADPDVPVKTFADEASTTLQAARQYLADLAAVGLAETTVDAFERHLKALVSAQVLWNTERGVSRSEAVLQVVDDSEAYRQFLLEAADLALRNVPDANGRLSLIREGEGLADLSSDLTDLTVLLTDYRTEFTAIRMDVDASAERTAALQVGLKSALAEEDVAKTLSGYKEMRDRCFALVKQDLQEIRAFARFAFRDDKGNSRRHLFASAYVRRKNRRARKAAQSNETVADTAGI